MMNKEILTNHVRTCADRELSNKALHPAWLAFIRYCSELQHGEIETLKIQDGLPVLAEIVRKKIKFAP
jgi:hypothetical protein